MSTSIEKFEFGKFPGITPQTARAIKKRFATWDEILETPIEQVLEVQGVSGQIAEDLLDTARAQVRLAERSAARVESVITEAAQKGDELYILVEIPADVGGGDNRQRNWKAKRILLTPAVCQECGTDMAFERGLSGKPWAELSLTTREDLVTRLEQHTRDKHPASSKCIVTGRELEQIRAENQSAL